MLACELRLAGVEPVMLERLPEISQIPKGNGATLKIKVKFRIIPNGPCCSC